MIESTAFTASGRFLLKRRLGSGGFGAVYEAVDRRRNAVVALKILRDAGDLYRFKREYRAVSGITHPNLVTLYELVLDDDQWCFSMELVEGTDFLTYVRGDGAPRVQDSSSEEDGSTKPIRLRALRSTEDDLSVPGEQSSPRNAVPRGWSPSPDGISRLLGALRQLSDGLSRLHADGIVHRDIKPANVLCTPQGRVVLLDFGISQELSPERGFSTRTVIGTPDYMSPEQAAEQPVTPASDWYSVGVLLYEVLTGALPFAGPPMQVLRQKVAQDPMPPSALWAGVPGALDELCRKLLQRDPTARPGAGEILSRLASMEAEFGTRAHGLPLPQQRVASTPFVGRERQLSALAAAYEASERGKTVVALAQGESGAGKSTLCRRFLRDLSDQDERAVILSGRCFEHEEVPFKALDGVIDSLSRYLQQLRPGEAESLLPRDIHALARLFPVLLQPAFVKSAPRRNIADGQQARQAAFGALRELLLRLSDRRPVVVYIDDLQWGDPDGISLLIDVLRPPDPPPLLLLINYRTGEEETNPTLQALRRGLRGELTRSVEVHEVTVGELSPAESEALIRTLLPEAKPNRASEIAAEAAGNTFFLTELSRSLAGESLATECGNSHSGGETAPGLRLDALIRVRVQRLPPSARRLLCTVAVAGQPIWREAAIDAAYGAATTDELQDLALLRSERLIRVRHARSRGANSAHAEELLAYHDRVREAIIGELAPAELAGYHLRLAHSLATDETAEPERLVFHFQRGGDVASAARFAVDASAIAHNALAYHQSARLCRLALDLGHLTPEQQGVVEARFADALAAAGRPKEAAERYLALAEQGPPEEAFERRRRAAIQFFGGGYVEEGREVLRTLLSAARLRLTGSPLGHTLSVFGYQLLIALRGLRFRERSESTIPPGDLLRIDTCIAVGFSATADPLLAGNFMSKSLWFSLKAGEPRRLAGLLACQALLARAFGRSPEYVERALSRATALAERINDPYSQGTALGVSGHIQHLEGQWRSSSSLLLRAIDILRSNCVEVQPQIDFLRQIHAYNLRWMGSLNQLSDEIPPLIADAVDAGQRASELVLRCNSSFLLALRDDEPESAEESVLEAQSRLASESFNIQHLHALDARLMILLYRGHGGKARKLLSEQRTTIRRSGTIRLEFFSLLWEHLTALVTLASSSDLRTAERAAGRLQRARPCFARPTASLIRALIYHRRQNRRAALAAMEEAEKEFVFCDMQLHATVAHLRRGEWMGPEGDALTTRARDWMAGQGIRAPDRMAAMIAPDTPGA